MNSANKEISVSEIEKSIEDFISSKNLKKVLLLPPDYTRLYSGGGIITQIFYKKLHEKCHVDIMPALGTHTPMTQTEWQSFFGDIPFEKNIVHNWRQDVVQIGEVPADFVTEISEGIMENPVPVEVNRRLLDKSYDMIFSIGQVVPHEVVGMANYSKNIFVGCGGSKMINASHALGAFYGMERIMGRDFSPVRKVFDYAEERFLKDLPITYVLTVTTNENETTHFRGFYIGRERSLFEQAVGLSQEINFIHLEKPIKKCVVFLDEREFKSTWLGNKAVYRTRMALADGGELIILAPGVDKFGEDKENDRLIRKYGYCGRKSVTGLVKTEAELQNNLSVAAHLIHGSSDGRFNITYCTRYLSKEEVEKACFGYMPYDEALKKYDISALKDGWNTVNNEEIYYISNPATGLWKYGE